MSIQQATVATGETIVESYNLFLNSDEFIYDGQNYDFQFGTNGVNTRDQSQYIRLTLVNFNMYKNWTDVNSYNQTLVLRIQTGNTNLPVVIQAQNYATIHDLGVNLTTALVTTMNTPAFQAVYAWGTVTGVLNSPSPGTGITGTTDNILDMTFTTTNPHGSPSTTTGDFNLQAVIDPSNLPGGAPIGTSQGADVGNLVGINRTFANDLVTNVSITYPTANTINMRFLYPAQRSTEPNIYIRANPTPQVLASQAFETPASQQTQNALNPSNIIAEIKIDAEFVQFEPTSDKQFFANMYQKSLNHLQLRLTDSRNRPVPVTLLDQAFRGNRFFTVCFRVDIVEAVAYGEIDKGLIAEAVKATSARFENLLINQKWGKPGYNTAPGY
jgi:hypothetical protein